jgi:hypothetical protein
MWCIVGQVFYGFSWTADPDHEALWLSETSKTTRVEIRRYKTWLFSKTVQTASNLASIRKVAKATVSSVMTAVSSSPTGRIELRLRMFFWVRIWIFHIQPLNMDLTEGPETSAKHNLTPGKYPKEHTQYSKHGESLKSRFELNLTHENFF